METLKPWRAQYCEQAGCQIIHYSAIDRGLADAYLIQEDKQVLGYGAVWNKYYPGRIVEFFAPVVHHHRAGEMCEALIAHARPTAIEAQTNIPLMHNLLIQLGHETPRDPQVESILFADIRTSQLEAPKGAIFRAKRPQDDERIFEHKREPVGDWLIELAGQIVATGGYLCHYNPPYGDAYMEVHTDFRNRGIGSYLVQEIKRVARENGKTPSARCRPDNVASRKTLERAGFSICGQMLAATLKET